MIIRTKDFQIPKKLEVNSDTLTPTYGEFYAEPFERGFGVTIGNSLRRVLLSSIVGAAITSIKINSVLHEFSAIPGVKEDVTDIIIATIEKDASLDMEMTVKIGRGYITSERNKEEGLPIGVIPIDSIFSPVQRVNVRIENARVGKQTDYDRLIMEVWTDGSIKPEEAINHAARIVKDNLNIFAEGESEEVEADNDAPVEATPAGKEEIAEGSKSDIAKNLFRSVEELELSVRSANCLKNANIHTLADLVKRTENEMLETKNFGRKSLNEIKELLVCMGLSFGMDVDSLIKNDEGHKI